MIPVYKKNLDQIDYSVLDRAKNSFIGASRRTLGFAKRYGFVPKGSLGSSSNVFQLPLQSFFKRGARNLFVTLLSEGLGTADDARPDDLTPHELERFWYNIGLKTVAVMTNDAAASGMQTVLISLYLPSSQPEIVFNESFMKGFLNGFVEGCRIVGCVYFSGETPQLKTKIFPRKLDIAGALFGILPPGKFPITKASLKAGDNIIFVESSGPHENGFTTLRHLATKLSNGYRTKLPSGQQYWEAINAPSKLYTPFIQDILRTGIQPTNIEPITGHGWQKLMRPKKTFRYVIDQMLAVPEIFRFVEEQSSMTPEQMVKIFNYGVGCAVFVHFPREAAQVMKIAKKHGMKAIIGGTVEPSQKREVIIKPLRVVLKGDEFGLEK